MKRLFASALALSLLSSGVAATGEVLDGKPATVMQVLTKAGYAATMKAGTGDDGPTITVKLKSEDVFLYLDGCKAGVCTRLTASNGYEVDTSADEVVGYVAAWNVENYSQAYLDTEEGSAYLDASYLLTGGYTRANMVAWLGAYLSDLNDFEADLP